MSLRGLDKLVSRSFKLIDTLHIKASKKGTVPLDDYLDRCLNILERISKLHHITTEERKLARSKVLAVYSYLQQYDGAVEVKQQFNRTLHEHILEDWYEYNLSAADAYSGGLGIASISGLTHAIPVGPGSDPWFSNHWPDWYDATKNLEDSDYWVYKK